METSHNELSSESRGTLTGSGLDLETKIFSTSGRGKSFLLTSLFIELIELFYLSLPKPKWPINRHLGHLIATD